MYYYPHHIGDFLRDTSRLSDSQCMAYLRLIWSYYDQEKPLPNQPEKLAFQIGADPNDVRLILEHYFTLDGDVYRHTRCDQEIAAFHEKSIRARKNAQARWKHATAMQPHGNSIDKRQHSNSSATAMQPHTDIDATALPLHSDRTANASVIDANQEPIYINTYTLNRPKPQPKAAVHEGFDEFWSRYPRKVSKVQALKAWNRLKPNEELQRQIIASVDEKKRSEDWRKDGGRFIPHPSTFLNNQRWDDKEPEEAGFNWDEVMGDAS